VVTQSASQPIFLGASNILAALTQMRHRFYSLFDFSASLQRWNYFLAIITLYPRFGLSGLAWGRRDRSAPSCTHATPSFKPTFEKNSFGERHLNRLKSTHALIPRTLALAAGQISLLSLVAMASFLTPGSIAVFMFAFNLQAVPLTIIGVSYSVAAFPTLARSTRAARKKEFLEHIEAALRHILFWSCACVCAGNCCARKVVASF